MTRRELRLRLWAAAAVLVATMALGVFLRLRAAPATYDLFRDLLPLEIALLAAYLANCFQERAMLVQSLRTLWLDMIEAKNAVMQYVHDPAPTHDKYQVAFNALSKVIDEMRGVYLNVGENDQFRGLFPYEPLHDIRKALQAYGALAAPKDADRSACAKKVLDAWYGLRPRFLYELRPRQATYPITAHGATDPRREGQPLAARYESPVEMYAASGLRAIVALPGRLQLRRRIGRLGRRVDDR